MATFDELASKLGSPSEIRTSSGDVWWLNGDIYTNGVWETHKDTLLAALRNGTAIDDIWLKGHCQYCHDECDDECRAIPCCGYCRYRGETNA